MARTVTGGSGKLKASVLGGRYASSSNTNPSGIPQGSPGGVANNTAAGRRPGRKLMVGDEGYLWLLVFIEVALMAYLRKHFRRYHGG